MDNPGNFLVDAAAASEEAFAEEDAFSTNMISLNNSK